MQGGGSYDFLIRHGGHAILVKPAANYVEGALEGVQADVIFLGTGTLGLQTHDFREGLYAQTVLKVRPKLVIPIDWDKVTAPLGQTLPPRTDKDLSIAFGYLSNKLQGDGIRFGILEGYQSVLLFKS
jgi:L-ascorbate metabolism protein UlaG (beta-lactamase superfamily)